VALVRESGRPCPHACSRSWRDSVHRKRRWLVHPRRVTFQGRGDGTGIGVALVRLFRPLRTDGRTQRDWACAWRLTRMRLPYPTGVRVPTFPALTDEQEAAVSAPAGPMLIVAGPGSGKTMVLAARIARLIDRQTVPPDRVLALTFAAKAAQELRSRLVRMVGTRGQEVDVATFHSLGLRLIRRWPAPLGLPSGEVTVLHGNQAERTLLTAAAAMGTGIDHLSPTELALGLAQVRRVEERVPVDAQWSLLAAVYERLLQRQGAVDFPAMLAWPLRLFREHPEALRLTRERYDAVLCDEAQDCALGEFHLVAQLAELHRHLVLVGDARQSIYGWRGADGHVLQRFEQAFPDREIVSLNRNFRSNGQIVALANALGRSLGGDPLWTTNPLGEPVRLYVAADEWAEAVFVATEITRLLHSEVVGPDDIAVLYRTHQQEPTLARALLASNVPLHGEGGRSAVRLSTIHQAKGAEWDVVFLVGCEEGLLPHEHAVSSDTHDDLLAELRLAYVAVTRPRQRLYLTVCRHRQRGGTHVVCRPSRFLTALPPGLLTPVA